MDSVKQQITADAWPIWPRCWAWHAEVSWSPEGDRLNKLDEPEGKAALRLMTFYHPGEIIRPLRAMPNNHNTQWSKYAGIHHPASAWLTGQNFFISNAVQMPFFAFQPELRPNEPRGFVMILQMRTKSARWSNFRTNQGNLAESEPSGCEKNFLCLLVSQNFAMKFVNNS